MSSGSESDDEYVPEEPEKVSEEESADDETDQQYEKEQEQKKAQKRKIKQKVKRTKKAKATNGKKETSEEEEDKAENKDEVANPEEEKKREEDLWAKFLEGTDTKPKSNISASSSQSQPVVESLGKAVTTTKKDTKKEDDSKERERRIFEFAGETIVVENDVIKEKIKTGESSVLPNKDGGPSRARGGGLSNVLGQLNKKNELSTLEKSKLDWLTYKKEEGIEEEIHSHNKGKDGYLDRQDFLERADLRQYEIERDLRMKRRSNR